MQNCPLAAVKIHAKQTRDGNNRWDRGRTGGRKGGREARRQMESWTVRQRRRGEMSSWQWRLKSVWAEFPTKRIMVGCCFFLLGGKIATFVYLYKLVCASLSVYVWKEICINNNHLLCQFNAGSIWYVRVCATQLGMDPDFIFLFSCRYF